MEWIKINKTNLPKGTVLAANFKSGTYGYSEKLIGYLLLESDIVYCEDDNTRLENCTHYIDIDSYDIKEVD